MQQPKQTTSAKGHPPDSLH